MSKRIATTGAEPAETPADRVTRLAVELDDAERLLAEMRRKRAEGETVDPLTVQEARDAVGTLGDRLRLAREAAAAADRAAQDRAAADAARARIRSVDDMLAATEANAREVHEAAERLGAALDALHQHARDVSAVEPALGARWINGIVERAKVQIAGAWPSRLSLELARPIPFRDAAKRAAWPQEERDVLRLLLVPAAVATANTEARGLSVAVAGEKS